MLLIKPFILFIQDAMKPKVKEVHHHSIPDIVSSDHSESEYEMKEALKEGTQR